MITVLDVFLDRGAYRPSDRATAQALLSNDSPRAFRGMLRARLTSLDADIARGETPFELAPRARATVPVSLALPSDDRRGYGVELDVLDSRGKSVAAATTALDVCADWTWAPRYGFLSDFDPGETEEDSERRVAALARYHINAVQFYDWMYRHHAFIPPTREFVDPLGRRLSLDVVERKVKLVQRSGMQAMAYVAIYGAAPDYAAEHPEQVLYRLDGQPFGLGDAVLGEWLKITNIAHPGWRAQLNFECRRAMATVGFDGIHLDQYGFVRTGYTADGERVDVEKELPGFLSGVREAVGGAPVAFNAVNDWPVAAVARSSVEPLYIEVWPPHDTLRDLREIILRARDRRGGRAPVIAAYLTDLLSDDSAKVRGGVHALRRLTAAIYLNGGSHIELGERDGVLRHPYFPNHYRLRPAEARAVRADYDFVARHAEYLFDPGWRDVSPTHTGGLNDDIRLEAPRYGPHAEPDSIWTIVRTRGDALTLGLINLRGMDSSAWNAPQPAPRRMRNLRMRLQMERPIEAAYFATPDVEAGRAIRLEVNREGRLATVTIPELKYWGMVIVRFQTPSPDSPSPEPGHSGSGTPAASRPKGRSRRSGVGG